MPIAQTHRMMPPASATGSFTSTVNGRTYTCANGAVIDVPEFDAAVLGANGWLTAAVGGVGTSSARPALTPQQKGTQFHDNTLGLNIMWDGKTWRNPTNGAAV